MNVNHAHLSRKVNHRIVFTPTNVGPLHNMFKREPIPGGYEIHDDVLNEVFEFGFGDAITVNLYAVIPRVGPYGMLLTERAPGRQELSVISEQTATLYVAAACKLGPLRIDDIQPPWLAAAVDALVMTLEYVRDKKLPVTAFTKPKSKLAH